MQVKHWVQMGAIGAMVCGTLFAAAVPARADLPGEHPMYMHALSDLEQAHTLLQLTDSGIVWQDQRQADREVSMAIHDCNRAAIHDDKDLDWTPPADYRDRPGRLRQANRLLHQALADLNQNEDNDAAADWQQAAIDHVNSALTYTHQAMVDARIYDYSY